MEASEQLLAESDVSTSPSNLTSPSSLWSNLTLLAASIQQLQERYPSLTSLLWALRIGAAFCLVLLSIGIAWFLAWKSVLRHVGFIRDIVHGVLGVKKPGKKRQVYERRSKSSKESTQVSNQSKKLE